MLLNILLVEIVLSRLTSKVNIGLQEPTEMTARNKKADGCFTDNKGRILPEHCLKPQSRAHAVRVCIKTGKPKSIQMKKISLLLAFIALFAATSFAKTVIVAGKNESKTQLTTIYQIGSVTYEIVSIQKDDLPGYSCSVTASWSNADGTKSSASVSVDCGNCTSRQAACDAAYRLVSIAVPD
jgi:hypothetical protein